MDWFDTAGRALAGERADALHARRDDDAFPRMLARSVHRYAQRALDLPRFDAGGREIARDVRGRGDRHREQEMLGAQIVLAGVSAFLLCQGHDGTSRWTKAREHHPSVFRRRSASQRISGRQDLNLRTSRSRTERSTKLSYTPASNGPPDLHTNVTRRPVLLLPDFDGFLERTTPTGNRGENSRRPISLFLSPESNITCGF